jgi:hypothetical protein
MMFDTTGMGYKLEGAAMNVLEVAGKYNHVLNSGSKLIWDDVLGADPTQPRYIEKKALTALGLGAAGGGLATYFLLSKRPIFVGLGAVIGAVPYFASGGGMILALEGYSLFAGGIRG